MFRWFSARGLRYVVDLRVRLEDTCKHIPADRTGDPFPHVLVKKKGPTVTVVAVLRDVPPFFVDSKVNPVAVMVLPFNVMYPTKTSTSPFQIDEDTG